MRGLDPRIHPSSFDRFMVGTDAGGQDGVYEQAIRNVRSGLLANLPPETAQAVAYGNAKGLFKLN